MFHGHLKSNTSTIKFTTFFPQTYSSFSFLGNCYHHPSYYLSQASVNQSLPVRCLTSISSCHPSYVDLLPYHLSHMLLLMVLIASILSQALILLPWTSYSLQSNTFIRQAPEYSFQMQISSCYFPSKNFFGPLFYPQRKFWSLEWHPKLSTGWPASLQLQIFTPSQPVSFQPCLTTQGACNPVLLHTFLPSLILKIPYHHFGEDLIIFQDLVQTLPPLGSVSFFHHSQTILPTELTVLPFYSIVDPLLHYSTHKWYYAYLFTCFPNRLAAP